MWLHSFPQNSRREEKPRFDTTDCVNGGKQRKWRKKEERQGRKENQGVAEENGTKVRGRCWGCKHIGMVVLGVSFKGVGRCCLSF